MPNKIAERRVDGIAALLQAMEKEIGELKARVAALEQVAGVEPPTVVQKKQTEPDVPF
jgi:hypothetical protein